MVRTCTPHFHAPLHGSYPCTSGSHRRSTTTSCSPHKLHPHNRARPQSTGHRRGAEWFYAAFTLCSVLAATGPCSPHVFIYRVRPSGRRLPSLFLTLSRRAVRGAPREVSLKRQKSCQSSIRLYGWQFASYQRMGRMLPALEGIEPMGIVPNVFTRLPVS